MKPGFVDTNATRIVLFDSSCRLCNASVRFICQRDPKGQFVFVPLSSERARMLVPPNLTGDGTGTDGSVVLIDGEHVYTRSTAALRIARRLRFPWYLLYAAILIPRPIRDAVYRRIAAARYRILARRAACELLPAECAGRILE